MKIKILYILLILLSCIPLLDLLRQGLPVTHDGQDHVARIANFYQSLSEGNLIPRWGGNLNWGYGHPVLMFLYPLPSYITSVFHLIGFSFVDGVKITFAIAFVASTLGMFLWAKNEWGIIPATGAAVLYGFAPYRFVDLYVRGALGEHVAFVFPPLILAGISGVSRGKNIHIWGPVTSVAVTGLLLSHNAVSLMMIPVIFLYALYVYYSDKNSMKFIVRVSVFSLIGILISSFFLIPAFLEGKYTLRDIVTGSETLTRFVPAENFFISEWNYGGTASFSKEIGVVQWLVVGLAVLFVFKTGKKYKTFLLLFLGLFAGSLFLMTDTSAAIWKTFSILQKFQFPWRFLTVSVFATSAMAAIVIYLLPKGIQRFILGLLIVSSVVSTSHMWKAGSYKQYPESFFTDIYNSTTDTGESSPIWSVRFMEKRPAAHIEVVEGVIEVQTNDRKSTYHAYTIRANEQSRVVENTLYFPGWNVYVDGKPVPVEFQDPKYRGLMTFRLDPGVHTVIVQFTETKLRTAANILTLAGIIAFVAVYYLARAKKI